MPWSSQAVLAQLIIIEGPNDGLFVYNGTPAAGNLVGSIAVTGGTDQFGNLYLAGEVTYTPAGPGFEACQNFGAQLTFYTAITEAGPWTPVGVFGPSGTAGTTMLLQAISGPIVVQGGIAYVKPLSPAGDDGAAINAIYAIAGVKTVIQAPGTFNIATTIAIPDGGTLAGSGLGTINQLAASSGATQNVITNASGATNCTVRDLLIDGNSPSNAGTWQSGIVLNNPAADPHHQIRGVRIQNTTGDGIVLAGRAGGTVVSDVSMRFTNGFGVNTIFDAAFVNVDIGNAGIDGFLIQGGSVRLSNCKAWFAGDKLVSGRGAGATLLTVSPPANAFDGSGIAGLTFTVTGGWGNGFHWTNISGSSQGPSGFGGTCAALTAQDNAGAGFRNDGTGGAGPAVVITGAEADSNNNNGTTGGSPNAFISGIEWGGSHGYVEGKSFDRGSNVNHQTAALNIVSTSGFTGNRFRLQFFGSLNDGSNMPPLALGSVPTANDCEFGAQGRSLRPLAASGTVAVDPFLAETFTSTMTGALTVSNPALTGTDTTGIFLVQGMKITLCLTQDGVGGHAVTLGGAFRLNGLTFTGVANATTAIEFVYDGTSWQALT